MNDEKQPRYCPSCGKYTGLEFEWGPVLGQCDACLALNREREAELLSTAELQLTLDDCEAVLRGRSQS